MPHSGRNVALGWAQDRRACGDGDALAEVRETADLCRYYAAQARAMARDTWCFADMGLPLRGLFLALRALGLFPPAKALKKSALRQAIGDSFEIEDERVFGPKSQPAFSGAGATRDAPNADTRKRHAGPTRP